MTKNAESYFDGREMYMVHRVFRREFSLMPDLVRGVAAGDEERAETIIQHMSGVIGTLHHHHNGEDAHVWPILLERAPVEMAPSVHLMESQHAAIDQASLDVDHAIETWRSGATAGSRAALAERLDELTWRVIEHMAAEEERVVPLMEKYITEDEWNDAVQQMVAGVDPETLPLSFGMVMYEGDPELIDQIIANMPPEVRPVMREIAGNAFREHAELIHGTATPPRSTDLASG